MAIQEKAMVTEAYQFWSSSEMSSGKDGSEILVLFLFLTIAAAFIGVLGAGMYMIDGFLNEGASIK